MGYTLGTSFVRWFVPIPMPLASGSFSLSASMPVRNISTSCFEKCAPLLASSSSFLEASSLSLPTSPLISAASVSTSNGSSIILPFPSIRSMVIVLDIRFFEFMSL